jgi:hypothetical protein
VVGLPAEAVDHVAQDGAVAFFRAAVLAGIGDELRKMGSELR